MWVGGSLSYYMGPTDGTQIVRLGNMWPDMFPCATDDLLDAYQYRFETFLLMYMRVFPPCVPGIPRMPEEDIRCSGTGVADDCELLCGCWESNPGPLEEQPVVLATEPSL